MAKVGSKFFSDADWNFNFIYFVLVLRKFKMFSIIQNAAAVVAETVKCPKLRSLKEVQLC